MNTFSNDLVHTAKDQLSAILLNATKKAYTAGLLSADQPPEFSIEIPGDISHGDFASNIAMVSARAFKLSPSKIAQALLDCADFSGSYFVRGEIAGPGFLNFFLSGDWFTTVISTIERMGSSYGCTDFGAGKKVLVEFVSANPTGPMHMGNARGGSIGDCLVSALKAAGFDAYSEFYVNDAGNQIEKFALSLEARYLQIYKGQDEIPFPEDGYHGEDITARAQQFADIHGDAFVEVDSNARRTALVDFALPQNIAGLKADLLRYRVEYDRWFHESTLYSDGTVEKVVAILKQKGVTFEKDGAIWYKATDFGAEKDEVLIRSNGNATYFAADIAYHYNKFAVRGFDQCIEVWGADHHGHVARLQGALNAVGLNGDKLHVVLMQMVRLMKNGEPYKMSKRTGKSVTLTDLLELVPMDAARFFFNMREPGSALDFDLDLAVEQSSSNPVYYVQYAHARICSILEKIDGETTATKETLALLTIPEEIELIRILAQYPSVIVGAAVRYDPACLTHYAMDVASVFHKFYNACKVGVDDINIKNARLALCRCTKTTIANVLAIQKITAPENM